MKNVVSLINSPIVMQKIESNSILQLDNPITSKSKTSIMISRNIPKKCIKTKLHFTPEMLDTIKSSSIDYQKLASRSDALFLKSDLHGVDLEIIKSKSYSLVGMKGTIVEETLSTFKIATGSDKSGLKVIPKSSCIFLVRRNGIAQYINGNQLLCSSGFRTSKKYKNHSSFFI